MYQDVATKLYVQFLQNGGTLIGGEWIIIINLALKKYSAVGTIRFEVWEAIYHFKNCEFLSITASYNH